MKKKSSSKIVKKRGVKRSKIITLSRKNVRITDSLGNGFWRHNFQPIEIGPYSTTPINLIPAPTGTRRVISAGWSIDQNEPVYVLSNYPPAPDRWFMRIYNPTGFFRKVFTWVITKSP
ncbi:hypothetical protein P4V43_01725 [Brevibacillus fortis]|uniref:hypothetical protein n=1 Tax=Brevibacillus fortis TaxID=2126352 RepID=UPI002E21D5CE|nr:hypothetical protein [Brevibacillus fortis]